MNQLAGINDQKNNSRNHYRRNSGMGKSLQRAPRRMFSTSYSDKQLRKNGNKNGLFSIFGNKDVYLTQPNTLRSMDGKTKVTWKNTPEGTKFWTIKGGSRIISSLFNGKNRLACTCDKGKKPMPVETRYFYSENDKPPLPTELPDKQVVNILLICKKGVIEELIFRKQLRYNVKRKQKNLILKRKNIVTREKEISNHNGSNYSKHHLLTMWCHFKKKSSELLYTTNAKGEFYDKQSTRNCRYGYAKKSYRPKKTGEEALIITKRELSLLKKKRTTLSIMVM